MDSVFEIPAKIQPHMRDVIKSTSAVVTTDDPQAHVVGKDSATGISDPISPKGDSTHKTGQTRPTSGGRKDGGFKIF